MSASNASKWLELEKNPDDYSRVKSKLRDSLMALAEREVPGLSKLVVHAELATPLSVSRFVGHPGGQIYGAPATPARLTRQIHRASTDVLGLYLVGADAYGHGIVGSMMESLFSVAQATSWSVFPKVMATAKTKTIA